MSSLSHPLCSLGHPIIGSRGIPDHAIQAPLPSMLFSYYPKVAANRSNRWSDSILFTEQTNVQGDVVETFKVPKFAAVDVIGVIYKATGKVLPAPDGSGDAVDEMAPLEGWHVNVRHTDEAPELEAYRVYPKAPQRGWL